MIDMHTHILPFLDDGPNSYEEALEILRLAEKEGISKVICTPHFIRGSYDNFVERVMPVFEKLKSKIADENINIELYPGSELYFDIDLPELIVEEKVLTLNNGKYVLIEFPMVSIPRSARDILYKIQLKGYYPIICHPERNQDVIRDYTIMRDFVTRGCFMQINTGSFLGEFGSAVKNTSIQLVKEGLIHFLSSDIHKINKKVLDFNKCIKIISRYIETEQVVNFVTENPDKILKSIELVMDEEEEIKTEGIVKRFVNFILGE